VITQTDTTHEANCVCSDCASGKRNRYFRSKRLKAEEFSIEQAYGIERRRLLNRSVVGWGVVRGFSLEQEEPNDRKCSRSVRASGSIGTGARPSSPVLLRSA
jgi:hypothetical protein